MDFIAEGSQFLAEMISKKERFVKVCLEFDSARQLADELTAIGCETSERTASNWRSRNFKKLPYDGVKGVQYIVEKKKLEASLKWSEAIKKAQSL